jgi:serine/threonine protein phosphatase PrpC
MKLSAWWRTDKGLKRENNQDTFLINESLGLFIVADGMGGHSGGEVASQLAVKSVEEFLFQNNSRIPSVRDLLTQAYSSACKKIYEMAQQPGSNLVGMGTTMVILYIKENSIYIGNVGDSRAYLHRPPNLWQLTEDHSLLNEHLRAGTINESQIKTFANKNVITRSVGYEKDVQADIIERPITVGDRFLLCSDGLSSLVNDDEICQILNSKKGHEVVDDCVVRALQKGGDDNVTVVLVEVVSN